MVEVAADMPVPAEDVFPPLGELDTVVTPRIDHSRRQVLTWLGLAVTAPGLMMACDSETDADRATAQRMFDARKKDANERHAQPATLNGKPSEQHAPHEFPTKSFREWQDAAEDPTRDVPNFLASLAARFVPAAIPGDSDTENFLEFLFTGIAAAGNFFAKGAYAPQTLFALLLNATSNFWRKKS